MKKADYDAGRGDLNLEENVNLRLRDLLERKKAQDLEGASERTRGHATRVLRPRLDELREMVVYGLSMREITDLLAEGGVQVNYHSLRGFLQRHMPREYAEYLVAKNLETPTSVRRFQPRSSSEIRPPSSSKRMRRWQPIQQDQANKEKKHRPRELESTRLPSGRVSIR